MICRNDRIESDQNTLSKIYVLNLGIKIGSLEHEIQSVSGPFILGSE